MIYEYNNVEYDLPDEMSEDDAIRLMRQDQGEIEEPTPEPAPESVAAPIEPEKKPGIVDRILSPVRVAAGGIDKAMAWADEKLGGARDAAMAGTADAVGAAVDKTAEVVGPAVIGAAERAQKAREAVLKTPLKYTPAGQMIEAAPKAIGAITAAGRTVPGVKEAVSAMGPEVEAEAEKFQEQAGPVANIAGTLLGTAAQAVGGGVQVAKAFAPIKNAFVRNVLTRAVTAGGITAAAEAGDVAAGKRSIEDALLSTIRSAGAGAVSVVPEAFGPRGIAQLGLQPAVDMIYELSLMKPEELNTEEGKLRLLQSAGMSLGFALRDVASGKQFTIDQALMRKGASEIVGDVVDFAKRVKGGIEIVPNKEGGVSATNKKGGVGAIFDSDPTKGTAKDVEAYRQSRAKPEKAVDPEIQRMDDAYAAIKEQFTDALGSEPKSRHDILDRTKRIHDELSTWGNLDPSQRDKIAKRYRYFESQIRDKVMLDESGKGRQTRAALDDMVDEAIAHRDRFGDVSVAMFDIVNQGEGNNVFGHEGWNYMMKLISQMIDAEFKGVGPDMYVLTRQGGDEGGVVSYLPEGDVKMRLEKAKEKLDNFVENTTLADFAKMAGVDKPSYTVTAEGKAPRTYKPTDKMAALIHAKVSDSRTGAGRINYGTASTATTPDKRGVIQLADELANKMRAELIASHKIANIDTKQGDTEYINKGTTEEASHGDRTGEEVGPVRPDRGGTGSEGEGGLRTRGARVEGTAEEIGGVRPPAESGLDQAAGEGPLKVTPIEGGVKTPPMAPPGQTPAVPDVSGTDDGINPNPPPSVTKKNLNKRLGMGGAVGSRGKGFRVQPGKGEASEVQAALDNSVAQVKTAYETQQEKARKGGLWMKIMGNFFDFNAATKAQLLRAGNVGEQVVQAIDATRGSNSLASKIYKDAENRIFDKLPSSMKQDFSNFLRVKGDLSISAVKGPEFKFTGGQTPAKMQKWLDELKTSDPEAFATFEALANEHSAINKELLDRAVDDDLMTREMADNLHAKYPFYMPREVLDHIDPATGTSFDRQGNKISVRESGIKELKGGTEGAVVANAEQSFKDRVVRLASRVMKNRAVKKLRTFVQQFPDNELGTKIEEPITRRVSVEDATDIVTNLQGVRTSLEQRLKMPMTAEQRLALESRIDDVDAKIGELLDERSLSEIDTEVEMAELQGKIAKLIAEGKRPGVTTEQRLAYQADIDEIDTKIDELKNDQSLKQIDKENEIAELQSKITRIALENRIPGLTPRETAFNQSQIDELNARIDRLLNGSVVKEVDSQIQRLNRQKEELISKLSPPLTTPNEIKAVQRNIDQLNGRITALSKQPKSKEIDTKIATYKRKRDELIRKIQNPLTGNQQASLVDRIAKLDERIAKWGEQLGRAENGEIAFPSKQLKPVPKGMTRIYGWEKGNKFSLLMPDDVAERWSTNDPEIESKALDFLATISLSKPLKFMATGPGNPAFALWNLPMDVQYAAFTTNEFGPELLTSVTKLALRIGEVQQPKHWKTLTDLYVERGGSMELLSNIYKERKPHEVKSDNEKTIEQIGDVLTWANTRSEMATRMALMRQSILNQAAKAKITYEAALKNMDIVDKAVHTASTYIDFRQGGSIGKGANKVFAYSNAALQALRGAARAYKKYPKKSVLMSAEMIALGYATHQLANVIAPEADKRISDEEKRRNWIMPLPFGYVDERGEKRYFYLRAPKDAAMRGFAYIGQQFYNAQNGLPVEWSGLAASVFDNTPIDSYAGMTPMAEATLAYFGNYDAFTNKPVWRGDQKVTPSHETYLDTKPQFKAAGEMTAGLPPYAQISPSRAEAATTKVMTNSLVSAVIEGMAGTAYQDKAKKEGKVEYFGPLAKELHTMSKWYGANRFVKVTKPYDERLKKVQEVAEEFDIPIERKDGTEYSMKQLQQMVRQKEGENANAKAKLNWEIDALAAKTANKDPAADAALLDRIDGLMQSSPEEYQRIMKRMNKNERYLGGAFIAASRMRSNRNLMDKQYVLDWYDNADDRAGVALAQLYGDQFPQDIAKIARDMRKPEAYVQAKIKRAQKDLLKGRSTEAQYEKRLEGYDAELESLQ